MGCFQQPGVGEFVRIVLELKGRKELAQREYCAYKEAIAKIAKKYGAKIAAREHVTIQKKPRMKGSK
ncbi:MAG TPA: hypothetical protein VN648_24700 [Candidatus Methylomirabilis sp.]|nr:hypothetical protein [Candidatus Methylomirabilis sp.]